MELRHLRYFLAVAEDLSFRRAAKRLNISQPPLSYQVHQLEAELGVKLIDRARRQIELTPAGKVFATQAHLTLGQVEQAARLTVQTSQGTVGHLRLAFTGHSDSGAIVELLRIFAKRHPDIHIGLQVSTTVEMIDAILDDRIDAGFVLLPVKATGLRIEIAMRQSLLLAVPKNSRLASCKQLQLDALADQRYISFPRHLHPGYYDFILALFRNAGLSLNISHEQSDIFSTLALVGAGFGVALVRNTARAIYTKNIAFMKLCPSVKVEVGLACKSENRSPVLPLFLEVVREMARRRTALK